MKQALILVQTLLLFVLPSAKACFNTTLGYQPNVSQATVVAFEADQLAHSARKVIKEFINEGNPYKIKTVVIDPGHGGHDPGCSGSNSREKHLALAIGKRLKILFNETYPDIQVLMTRDKDVFIPLHKRAALANRNQADLFISIHCNFMPGSSATKGTETYVMGLHTSDHNLKVAKRENAAILLEEDYEKNYDYDPNSPEGHIMLTMFQSAHLNQSILFAEKAEQQMKITAGRRSRGVKQAGFVVLKETTMPSVLVEAGFLSSKIDQAFLKTEAGQMKIAKSLLEAFTSYKSIVESPEYLQFSRPVPEVASLPKSATSNVTKVNLKPQNAPSKSNTNQAPKRDYGPVPPPQDPPKKVFTNVYNSPKKAPVEVANKPTESTEPINIGIQFFVQLSASSKLQDTQSGKWVGLGYPVEVVKENGMYKYRARNFKNLREAQLAKRDVQNKGFLDAFLVAYKNGKKIPLNDALKELGVK